MKPCNVKLLTYSGSEVKVLGQLLVNVTYENQSYNNLPLVIVDINKTGQPMLLSRNWLENIVLDWKSVVSGFRPTLTSHYAKPEHKPILPLTHANVTKPGVSKDVELLKCNYCYVFQGK